MEEWTNGWRKSTEGRGLKVEVIISAPQTSKSKVTKVTIEIFDILRCREAEEEWWPWEK